MGMLFVGLTGGLGGAELNHVRFQAKRPRDAFLTFHGEVGEGGADQRGVETWIRRCPSPAFSAASGFHFAMDYILTEGKSEASRRAVTPSDPNYMCYRPKEVFKILKQRGDQAQSSLCTLPGTTAVPEAATFGVGALGKQTQPRLAGVACHQNWQDKPLSGGILFELDEEKSQLDSILVYWAKFLRRCKTGWCHYFCGGKVSGFVPRGLVNALICTERDYRNKPLLGIATRCWH